MDKKMIFLDLDGTLLNDKKELPEINKKAIEAAVEAGHKVLICTGRPLCRGMTWRLKNAGSWAFPWMTRSRIERDFERF